MPYRLDARRCNWQAKAVCRQSWSKSINTLGAIYGKAGEFEKAEYHLTTAQRLADERNSPDRVANAQLEQAFLYERTMHTASAARVEDWKQDALGLVRSAITCYERLGARLKLRQARALEEKLIDHASIDEPLLPDSNVMEPTNCICISLSPSHTHLTDGSTPTEGERVQVTVLWLNLELRSASDEEDSRLGAK